MNRWVASRDPAGVMAPAPLVVLAAAASSASRSGCNRRGAEEGLWAGACVPLNFDLSGPYAFNSEDLKRCCCPGIPRIERRPVTGPMVHADYPNVKVCRDPSLRSRPQPRRAPASSTSSPDPPGAAPFAEGWFLLGQGAALKKTALPPASARSTVAIAVPLHPPAFAWGCGLLHSAATHGRRYLVVPIFSSRLEMMRWERRHAFHRATALLLSIPARAVKNLAAAMKLAAVHRIFADASFVTHVLAVDADSAVTGSALEPAIAAWERRGTVAIWRQCPAGTTGGGSRAEAQPDPGSKLGKGGGCNALEAQVTHASCAAVGLAVHWSTPIDLELANVQKCGDIFYHRRMLGPPTSPTRPCTPGGTSCPFGRG